MAARKSRTTDVHMAAGPGRGLRLRAAIALGTIAVAFLLLIMQLGRLQIAEGEVYRRLANQQQIVNRRLSAPRGRIYDREGRLLASSVRAWSVFADPKAVEAPQRVARLLAQALNLDADDIADRLQKDCYFVWIKRQVSAEEAAKVRALDLAGVHMRQESRRVYPQGRLAAHVVGFTDIDGRGLAGIEHKMDAILRGRPGMERVLCDGGRRIIRSAFDKIEVAPFKGFDIRLTLDAYVQSIVEEELAQAVEKHKPECATAVVLDTRDGSVLAMASWPGFDPQDPAATPVSHQRNMAICDAYEFGSVFKPITIGLALDEQLVSADTEFDCHQGQWQVGRRVLHDAHPYGLLSVSDILCHSSNIGAAQVGMRLGIDRLFRGVRSFGFGRSTGIALPGESGGIVRPLPAWNDYSIVSVAFGQELSTTALAMARAFAAFANGGALLQPRIVQSVSRAQDGFVAYTAAEPIVTARPVSSATAAEVLTMMRRVVQEGTGRRAQLDEYAVAGKTGTAQLLSDDGRGYSQSRYLGSFIGIAPVPESRIVVLVALKAPRENGYYGGLVAAPAVRSIILRTLSYLEVPATEPGSVALGETL